MKVQICSCDFSDRPKTKKKNPEIWLTVAEV